MKAVQKRVTILIWICSIFCILLSAVLGLGSDKLIPLTMAELSACVFVTIVYFIPMPEKAKAVLVLVVAGLETLAVSCFTGGNSGTFITSFLVLGMAILYFEPVVLVAYSSIYLTICSVVYAVDKVYIIGTKIKPYMGIILLFCYAIMTASLYIATKYGWNYIQATKREEEEAQERAKVIQKQASAALESSSSLYEKVEICDQTVKELAGQARSTNDNSNVLKESEEKTIAIFYELNDKIRHCTGWIDENYKLVAKLTDNYCLALNNVTESKEFSDNAQNSMNELLEAIGHAHACIQKSTAETDKIESIIKDINEIASQTNLLAINASIEAARVGENGAGFDIVAEQIRTLSVQSKNASENINKILGVLSQSLVTTSEKVGKGLGAIKYGINNLDHMVNCIETINCYSRQSQLTLNEEAQVFEKMRDEFEYMVREVEKSMDAAEDNLSDIEVVAESVESQTNRTSHVSELLQEMEGLANQVKRGGTEDGAFGFNQA